MNPDELAARNAIMQRLVGNPQPPLAQMGPGAGMPVPPPAPQPPPPDQGGQQLGTQTRKASPTEKMVKALLPATSTSYHPEVQGLSKVLLTRLIQSL